MLQTAAGIGPSYRFTIGSQCLAFMLFGVSITIIGPLFQPVREEFAVSNATVGLIVLFASGSHIAGTLIGSYFSDQFGRRIFVFGGPITLGCGLLIAGLAPTIQIHLLGGALLGLGLGLLDGPCNALLIDIAGARSARMLNIAHSVIGLGAVAGPLLAAVVYASTGDWRPVYIGLAVGCVLAAVPFLFVPMPAKTHDRIGGWRISRVLSMHIGMIMAALFCAVAIEITYQFWLPSFLELERGYERALAIGSLTLISIGMVAGRALMALAASRWDHYWILAIGMALCAVTASVAMLPIPQALSLVFFGLSALLVAGGFPMAVSLGTANVGPNVGAATGIIVSAAGAAGIIFPPTAGVLAESGQLNLVMLIPVPVALAGAACVLCARKLRRISIPLSR